MEWVRVYNILGTLTEHAVRNNLSHSCMLAIEVDLERWVRDLPEELHLYNRSTGEVTAYCSQVRQLHLPYFTALMISCRGNGSTNYLSARNILSSSFVTGIFEEFLAWGETSHLPPASIFHLMVAALVQVSCHGDKTLWESAEPELEVINTSLNELAKRFPTAIGAQRVIQHALRSFDGHKFATKSPQLHISSDHAPYFTAFGGSLCKKWPLIMEHNNDAQLSDVFKTAPTLTLMDQTSYDPLRMPVTVQTTLQGELAFAGNETGAQQHKRADFDLDDFSADAYGNWVWSDWMSNVNR